MFDVDMYSFQGFEEPEDLLDPSPSHKLLFFFPSPP